MQLHTLMLHPWASIVYIKKHSPFLHLRTLPCLTTKKSLKDAQPPAAVLKKIADALDTTVDFLVNGNTSDKANAALQDAEVIRYFKEVDALPVEDKSALLRVIAGFIRDVKTKQAYAQ